MSTTSSRSSADWLSMPDSLVRRSPGAGPRLVLAVALGSAVALLLLALPSQAFGRTGVEAVALQVQDAAPAVDDRCSLESFKPDGQKQCDQPILGIGNVLSIAGIVVAAGLLVLVVAYLVLRRRASVPLAPTDAGEWWLCPKCGSTNVVGSARCYACGTWQR